MTGLQNASAATLTVTTKADTDSSLEGCTSGGQCSLREAIKVANMEGPNGEISTIRFAPKAFANRQTLIIKHGDLPAIACKLKINGPTTRGAGVTITPRRKNSGVGLTLADGNVDISALSIAGFQYGLAALGGHSLVENSTFDSNDSGIITISKRPGTIAVQNSTFSNNGIGLFVYTPRDTSAVYAPATIRNCTLVNGIYGTFTYPSGQVNAFNSLIAANYTGNAYGNIKGDSNIIGGSADDLRLDPRGLANNGGPTPTVALLFGSSAINAGSASFPTDQRGLARDGKPDVGAFEFVNVAPRVRVTPQIATDKVGANRTFTLTASDSNGDSDISEMWLLINDHLDFETGTSLVYQPAARVLFLNQGGEFLPPIHIGSEAGPNDVLDNGAVRVVGSEVQASLLYSGDTVTISIPITVKEGLIGKNTLYTRVSDASGALDPAASPDDFGFIRSGKYTVETLQPNSPPTLSRLSPRATTTNLSESGEATTAQNFGFYAQDPDGAGDIRRMRLVAGKTPDGLDSASFVFVPRSRRLYLLSDEDETGFTSGIVGTEGILENNHVRVDLAKVKFQMYSDGKTLGLILPLQAKNGLLGKNTVWLYAIDSSGATAPGSDAQGYVASGAWLVTAPTPSAAPAPSTTPSENPSAGAS